jgi:hypothetical protein
MLNRTKNSKPVKSDLTRAKSIKSINSIRFYEFIKFMIRTKSGPNLTLQCQLTSFPILDISFKPFIR